MFTYMVNSFPFGLKLDLLFRFNKWLCCYSLGASPKIEGVKPNKIYLMLLKRQFITTTFTDL